MAKHPHETHLLDRAEVERAIEQAKALRAEMFRTGCAAIVGFVRTLMSTTIASLATLRSRGEGGERVHMLTQTEDAASGSASAR
jgi:hypothetical protein